MCDLHGLIQYHAHQFPAILGDSYIRNVCIEFDEIVGIYYIRDDSAMYLNMWDSLPFFWKRVHYNAFTFRGFSVVSSICSLANFRQADLIQHMHLQMCNWHFEVICVWMKLREGVTVLYMRLNMQVSFPVSEYQILKEETARHKAFSFKHKWQVFCYGGWWKHSV